MLYRISRTDDTKIHTIRSGSLSTAFHSKADRFLLEERFEHSWKEAIEYCVKKHYRLTLIVPKEFL
jgi:hypothetical protein